MPGRVQVGMPHIRWHAVLAVLSLLGWPTCGWADQGVEYFERKIRPVLIKYCYECHSGDSQPLQGGLRLDSRDGLLRGGDSGAALVPGDAATSLLLEAIRYEGLEMPPDGRLPERIIRDFEHWIASGAVDPRGEGPPTGSTNRPPSEQEPGEAAGHWAFRLPESGSVSRLGAAPGARTRIDRFIHARLSAAGLSPSPEATRRELIRRVTFDLLGLPPTPEEVASFVHDPSPLAYERVVERLFGSPHYGERLARIWLDLARYAEDQAHIVGDNKSLFYPNAYLYRAWLIDAFNEDLAYDQFILRQLAADLIESVPDSDYVALGFLGLGPKYYRRNSPEVMADEWEDRVDTVSRTLLGLTVACARCHDHKYDPISTEDYYALAGVFASTEMFNRPLAGDVKTNEQGQAEEPLEAMHIVRDADPQDLRVMIRGDVTNLGAVVPRRFLEILSRAEHFRSGSGRRELAEAIVAPHNPLTARVMVNRLWGLHFGRPLVSTPSNFGRLGAPPSHPELLDDLAIRFVETGWSIKEVQREIVLSATYRQSSASDPIKSALDPANSLLWRMNRKRLTVESWRDALLLASGQLDRALGGPSLRPRDPDERRRTLYSYISRLELDSMLAVFDFPDPNAHSARRVETTTPLQKLFVLNSPFIVHQAELVAERLLTSASGTEGRIEFAYQLLFARLPQPLELDLGLEFLEDLAFMGETAAWQQYTHALLASNELLIVD